MGNRETNQKLTLSDPKTTVFTFQSKVFVTNQCAHFLVVIFLPLMNLVEVDVLLTAPPPDPLILLRDEKDVKESGWPTLNKLSKPGMPNRRESNGLENAELSAVCGCELRL